MLRKAAFASSVVASMPTVCPLINPASASSRCRNARTLNESAARHAIARSESRPSKYPSSSSRTHRPGAKLGRPRTGA